MHNSGHAAPTAFIVIPVRNRWGFTRACLDSLLLQTYSCLKIVVVDDGSTDETRAGIVKEFPDVEMLEGDGHLWWTGATALAVDWVLERCRDDDFLLTLNNDTAVDPEYVETLIRVHGEVGPRTLVGSAAVDIRDRDTIADGGPLLNWLSARWSMANKGVSLVHLIRQGIVSIQPDVLSGRGTLIPVRCIREIGNFDARRLPHYAADYEFSARAALAGYRLMVSYEAPVYSEVEATGVSTVHGRLPWRTFGRMYFSRKSPACLVYRWRFARLSAPRKYLVPFLFMDTVRAVGGGLRDQVMGRS